MIDNVDTYHLRPEMETATRTAILVSNPQNMDSYPELDVTPELSPKMHCIAFQLLSGISLHT